jgi:hypothetical protein
MTKFKVKIIGGQNDGSLIEFEGKPPSLNYFVRRLTINERNSLNIDNSTQWKSPEDWYELKSFGDNSYDTK